MSAGARGNLVATRLSRPLKKTFLSLRNRNFRLYFIGQVISNTGNWLTNVALILLVLKITGSGVRGRHAGCLSVRPDPSSCRRGRERSPTDPTSGACCC